ncbi:MAG: type I restriction enzyme HsdR N-terminal domain-containing protein [Bacteroidia bacterium]
MNFIFPDYPLKKEIRDGQEYVWDIIRKKWISLQKEEYIRQLLIHFLINKKGISASLISVEREIQYNNLRKRFDVVVFDSNAKPLILCEVKASDVTISQDTLQQIARYNKVIQAPHLLITNGIVLLFFSLTEEGRYMLQKNWLTD